jgi:3-phenylpropionate/cinnamic acid dioxygenase small subunit
MRRRGNVPVSYDLQRDIERFLFREARLLDEGHFDDWLALFADDVRYWVPTRVTTSTFETSIAGDHDLALLDDDKSFLRARIQRLHSGLAHAETPPSRTRRFLANIEIDQDTDDEFDVGCNMLIYQTRLERTEIAFMGRREDRLRKSNGSWLIARRKIILDQTLIPRTISIFL